VDVKEFTFEKVPVGALQVALVALPPMVPANVMVPPAHTVCGTPAFAVAAGFTVIITVDVTAGQGPAGSSVVKVSVTVPLAMLGVYVDVKELTLEKVPLGALHVELDAPPPIVPAKVMDPPAHTVCAGPAFAVATGFTVTVTLPDGVFAVHGAVAPSALK
jgi:hypothetical protein